MTRWIMAMSLLTLPLTAGCLSWHTGALPGEPEAATFKQVAGARVHYTDSQTSGPAVVLVHGFGSQMRVWDALATELSRTHRVIALDLKGFGWTDRPEGDYSPQAEADLVWALLDELGVERTSIVAHSWGSSVALQMALSKPERARRMVLMDAWVYEDQLPAAITWSRAPAVGELIYGLWYDQRTEDKLALAFYDKRFVTQEMVEAVEKRNKLPGTKAAALAAVRGQRYADVEASYSHVEQPILLIWGREDRVSHLWYGERLDRQLPNSRLMVLPRCGHFPMIEAHTESSRAVLQFLGADRLRARGGRR